MLFLLLRILTIYMSMDIVSYKVQRKDNKYKYKYKYKYIRKRHFCPGFVAVIITRTQHARLSRPVPHASSLTRQLFALRGFPQCGFDYTRLRVNIREEQIFRNFYILLIVRQNIMIVFFTNLMHKFFILIYTTHLLPQ